MPLTLIDEMNLEKDSYRKGIVQSLIEQVNVQDMLTWESTDAMQTTITRLTGVPRVPLRLVNEVPDGVQVYHTQSQETLYIMDTDIDIDPVLLMSKNQIMSLEVAQVRGTMAGIGYQMNDLFINGDPGSDIREPQGLKVRLRDDIRFANNTVNATGNTTKLDFSPDASDANLFTTLYKLDELYMHIMRGQMDAWISNQQFVLNIWSALRKLKLLDTTKDQFDREFSVYRNAKVVDIGYKPEAAIDGSPDATTVESNQIIGFDADDYDAGNDPGVGGGANAYTDTNTVYAARFAPSTGKIDGSATDGLVALQFAPLKVDPIGKTEEPPHFHRTNLLWVFNPCVPLDIRCIGRLVGLQLT